MPEVNIGDTQSKLRLILKTEIDMSSDVPTVLEIYYWNPANTNEPKLNTNRDGQWTAAILAGSEVDGKVYYDLLLADALARGTWTFRVRAVYSDSREVFTRQVSIEILN